MEPGYLGQMLAAATRQGLNLEIVDNLAVGGTTSAYGLFRLKTSDALDRSDLLIIEYALNDAFIYGDERRQFRHWARIYEGILRYALARNPRLRVCTLIFGARNGSWLSSVPSIDAGIRYLSDWYGAIVVDISRNLIRRFGRDVVQDPTFYADQGHYARPVATAMVADLAIDGLVAGLAVPMSPGSLPSPVDPEHFAEAGVLDVQALFAAASDAPLIEYHNRRFAFTAIDLARHRLDLELSAGRLLGVFHMSAPNVAPLMLARGDSRYHCSLLKAGVRDAKFKFLAAMLPCEFLYGADLLQTAPIERVTLAQATVDATLKIHLAKDNIASVPGTDPVALPLLGLLYSGTLRHFSVVTALPHANSLRAANSA
ncbi:MAG: SGNH/GDSL hydrolase family protein [Proteobacteria bacterium]|nr:SGNH/GDSL hydrolase family protein [Pseudomonadota bacterium]